MKKQYVFLVGLAAIILVGGLVYFAYVRSNSEQLLVSRSSNSSSVFTPSSISSSSSISSNGPALDRAKHTLSQVAKAIEVHDQQLFEKYVDTQSMCNSVYETLVSALQGMYGAIMPKETVIQNCITDIHKYVKDPNARTNDNSAGVAFGSVAAFFEKLDTATVRQENDTVTVITEYNKEKIVFIFDSSSDILRWKGFVVPLKMGITP